jgi:hypothetical protein
MYMHAFTMLILQAVQRLSSCVLGTHIAASQMYCCNGCCNAGTMLFGESCDEDTAQTLLNTCWEHGINFYDTAEMYPVPQRAETYGDSERMLGRWVHNKPRCVNLLQPCTCCSLPMSSHPLKQHVGWLVAIHTSRGRSVHCSR